MSTFLELCQHAAEESGTFPSLGTPETTVSQTGRSQRLINWVRRSWTDIQMHRADWRWLEAEMSGTTIAAQQEYSAADLGVTFRFGRWLHHDDRGHDTFSLYLASEGQATEGYLQFRDWPDFRRIYMVGSAASRSNKPQAISITPARKVALYPIPDAAYTIRGRYVKTPQTLMQDGDIPECPEQFHEIIVWRTLDRLSTFDEAFEQKPIFRREYQRLLSELVADQTPRITRAEPFA